MPRGFVNRRDRFRWDNVHFPDGENPLSSDFVKVGDETLTDVLDRIDDGLCYVTATPGASVSFTTSVAEPMKALKVAITATQSGSGDPAPDNIRPISGFTSSTITVTDGVTPETYTVQFGDGAGTVYGGILDVVNGTLTVTHAYITFNGTESWQHAATQTNPNGTLFVLVKTYPIKGWTSSTDALCDLFSMSSNGSQTSSAANTYWWTSASNGWRVIYGDPLGGTSADTFTTFLETNNMHVVAELATPVVYNVTPAAVNTVEGTNTVSASTGAILELIYPDTFSNEVNLIWQAIAALQGNRSITPPPDDQKKAVTEEEPAEEIVEEQPVKKTTTRKKSTNTEKEE